MFGGRPDQMHLRIFKIWILRLHAYVENVFIHMLKILSSGK